MADLSLYTYWRSTAAYRVRIALELKGLAATVIPVNLLHGEQLAAEFGAINPQHMVPVLEDEQVRLTQSLAILEYLEEVYPTPPLIPSDPVQAAQVRAIAQLIACDIHPLNVPRVTGYLTREFGITEAQKTAWMHHWMQQGLAALESLLTQTATHDYCVGPTPTIADCCLIPQVYSARRFSVILDHYPRIRHLYDACHLLSAFVRAAPEQQPDCA
jgi:maleylacetoacetate isomerase